MKTVVSIFLLLLMSSAGWSQDLRDLTAAEDAFDQKEYEAAIPLYTKFIDIDNPITYYVRFKRAKCYYFLRDYETAISELDKVLTIPKTHRDFKWIKGQANWGHARICSQLNKKADALNYLKKAASYMEDSYIYSTMAFIEIQLQEFDDALNHSTLSIQLDTTNAYAYSNRALVLLKFSMLNQARKDIDRSIELDASNPYAYKHSALIYLAHKEMDLACAHLNKAEELDYVNFGNETDKNEVAELIQKHCTKEEEPKKE